MDVSEQLGRRGDNTAQHCQRQTWVREELVLAARYEAMVVTMGLCGWTTRRRLDGPAREPADDGPTVPGMPASRVPSDYFPYRYGDDAVREHLGGDWARRHG